MSAGEGFAARWSRMKSAESRGEDAAIAAPQEAPSPEAPTPAAGETEAPALPDPDSLGLDADFSVFMHAGVPKALQRRALRRLWSLDPVFANVDGLVDYDDEFSDAAKGAGSLRHTNHAARRLARRVLEQGEQAPAATGDAADDGERTDDA